jgi:hypothetical protein
LLFLFGLLVGALPRVLLLFARVALELRHARRTVISLIYVFFRVFPLILSRFSAALARAFPL